MWKQRVVPWNVKLCTSGGIKNVQGKAELNEHLKGKGYLIGMDNIRKTQIWDQVGAAFPDESNGSRILITNRIIEVAPHVGTYLGITIR